MNGDKVISILEAHRSTEVLLPSLMMCCCLQEDLDVVAFAYAPVPYTVNPFLTSFNKHPDYLIHKAQAAGKGRARGGVLSPASPMTRKSISKHLVSPFSNDQPISPLGVLEV